MKNAKTLLIVLIAFTIGYIIRMLVEPKVDDSKSVSEPISQEEAQTLTDNYIGANRYVVVDVEMLETLNDAASKSPEYTGFVMYNAASAAGSPIADQTIIATINGDAVVGQYYMMPFASYRSTCPKMCDIQGLAEPVSSPSEPLLETKDSVIPDNEEHPQ